MMTGSSARGEKSCLKRRAQSIALLASLLFLSLAGSPPPAAASDVVFYELTEAMTFDGVTRTGAGALAGEAQVGRSPLCPRDVLESLAAASLARRDRPCYVTAIGQDVLSLATFGGIFKADIQVKVQGDNLVDAPELVVMVATIAGDLLIADTELRLLAIPRGTLTITHVLDPTTFQHVEVQGGDIPLTGIVRLPFAIGPDGRHRKARSGEPAFYLSDQRELVRVESKERSLGLATARFEVNFHGQFGGAGHTTAE
jgi:hypothetical protein